MVYAALTWCESRSLGSTPHSWCPIYLSSPRSYPSFRTTFPSLHSLSPSPLSAFTPLHSQLPPVRYVRSPDATVFAALGAEAVTVEGRKRQPPGLGRPRCGARRHRRHRRQHGRGQGADRQARKPRGAAGGGKGGGRAASLRGSLEPQLDEAKARTMDVGCRRTRARGGARAMFESRGQVEDDAPPRCVGRSASLG